MSKTEKERTAETQYRVLRSCVQDALDCLPDGLENYDARWILRMALAETEKLGREPLGD
jgi:hypothetical protein